MQALTLSFKKYVAAGNDFVVLEGELLEGELIQKLCHRQYGVGADGCIFIQGSQQADFSLRFFNSDGYEASMCGNGLRCAVAYCHRYFPKPSPFSFEVSEELYYGKVVEDNLVLTWGYKPTGYKPMTLELESMTFKGAYLNTGVPHFVCFISEALETFDVQKWGEQLRFHSALQPYGANIDFCMYTNGKLWVRTYERGVEAETLACGTGVMAASLCLHKNTHLPFPMTCQVHSGEEMQVCLKGKDFCLKGSATSVFSGTFESF